MSDQELLEMAAKAAGLEGEFRELRSGHRDHFKQIRYKVREAFVSKGIIWSPLTDDGDALRLAIELRIDLTFYNGFQEVHAESSRSDGLNPSDEKYGEDVSSATRRAIVRAAAEIGRAMP